MKEERIEEKDQQVIGDYVGAGAKFVCLFPFLFAQRSALSVSLWRRTGRSSGRRPR